MEVAGQKMHRVKNKRQLRKNRFIFTPVFYRRYKRLDVFFNNTYRKDRKNSNQKCH